MRQHVALTCLLPNLVDVDVGPPTPDTPLLFCPLPAARCRQLDGGDWTAQPVDARPFYYLPSPSGEVVVWLRGDSYLVGWYPWQPGPPRWVCAHPGGAQRESLVQEAAFLRKMPSSLERAPGLGAEVRLR